jgi:hypothetical protein
VYLRLSQPRRGLPVAIWWAGVPIRPVIRHPFVPLELFPARSHSCIILGIDSLVMREELFFRAARPSGRRPAHKRA